MNSPIINDQSPITLRILVRGTNWLGDAVMTTPALLRLREKFPRSRITLLTPEKLKDLWLHHSAINETISIAPGESVFSVAKKLRDDKFDLALVLPNSPRSAIEVFLAGISRRIGYARPWRNFFLTQTIASRATAVKMQKRPEAEIRRLISERPETGNRKPDLPKSAHQIYEYLHLTAALGADAEALPPQLFVTPEEIEAAKSKFGLKKISGPVFGFKSRRGVRPGEALAGRKVHRRRPGNPATDKLRVAFIRGGNDRSLTTQIESAIGDPQSAVFNLAGKTSLRELMALLKICRVLLSNDTGPMHVAAALGTPVVVPFGSTSPELTGPGLPGDARNHLLESGVPCSPCFLRECPIDFRCMNGIGVERVKTAVESLQRGDD